MDIEEIDVRPTGIKGGEQGPDDPEAWEKELGKVGVDLLGNDNGKGIGNGNGDVGFVVEDGGNLGPRARPKRKDAKYMHPPPRLHRPKLQHTQSKYTTFRGHLGAPFPQHLLPPHRQPHSRGYPCGPLPVQV